MVHNNIKRKGTNFERYLREKFFKSGIICFRVAGSGSTRKVPALDLICVCEPLRPLRAELPPFSRPSRLRLHAEVRGAHSSPIPTDSLSVGLLNLIYNLNIHREHPSTFARFNQYLNFSIPALKGEVFSYNKRML